MNRIPAFLAALLLSGAATADEAVIRKVMGQKLGGVRIERVTETPIPGIFEIRYRSDSGSEAIYSNANATYVFFGNLIEVNTGRNLTTAIRFSDLPLDLAVKVTRGSGRRVLAIFSDPYCPACRSFEAELAKLDDITIHYFMYPVIRPELADHSKAAWCAKDRTKAWLELAQRGKPPAGAATCSNPIEKVLDLGRSLGVGSTPTVFLANGERIKGGMPAARLAEVLDSASPQAKK
ncbi:MAG: DsbC family protein [Burkholderiales bacterium]